MKSKILITFSLILAAFIVVVSCKKEDENVTFTLSSLKAGDIDMNGATPPSNVPSDPTITAVFSVDVNAATANSNTILLERDYDGASIDLTITSSGSTVTIVPDENLGNGSLYELRFTSGIQSTDGQSLTAIVRSFTTDGNFTPSGQIAFWTFEENANDQAGNFNPSADGVVDITYVDSYSPAAGKCASFNGTTSIIEIPNGDQLTNTSNFSVAFWVKTKSEGHVNDVGDPKGHFVFGLAAFYGFQFEIPGDYTSCKLAAQYELADGSTTGEDLWFAGTGVTGANGGWQGFTFDKDLTGSGGVEGMLKDKWAHVACVYDGTTKVGTLYINGEKMKAQDFNLWPDEDPKQGVVGLKYGGNEPDVVNELALGFIQSRAGTLWDVEPWGGYDFPTANHFGGMLDDLAIFHRVLTEQEISLMSQSSK